MCKDVFECQAGCKSYYGGEVRHHEDCVQYPESFAKMYDEAIMKIKELKSAMQELVDREKSCLNIYEANRILSEMSFKYSKILNQ